MAIDGKGNLWVAWPTLTLHIAQVPATELGPRVHDLERRAREQSGDALGVQIFQRSVLLGRHFSRPRIDLNESSYAIHFSLDVVAAIDGWLAVEDYLLDAHGDSVLDAPIEPPSAERVAARALSLLALSFRGLLEQDAGTPDEPKAEELRQQLLAWVIAVSPVADEMELDEMKLVSLPIGKGDPQAIVNAVWRAEGAQALLWALEVRALPAHDAQEHPYKVAKDVGVLGGHELYSLNDCTLRSEVELEWMAKRLLAIHWRFVEHRVYPGKPVDMAKIAQQPFVGGADLSGIAMVDGDLAIKGEAITLATLDAVGWGESIARERHQAINWLVSGGEVYSEVDTST